MLQLATEYEAEPRDADRWQAVSAENREKFALGATWGICPCY